MKSVPEDDEDGSSEDETTQTPSEQRVRLFADEGRGLFQRGNPSQMWFQAQRGPSPSLGPPRPYGRWTNCPRTTGTPYKSIHHHCICHHRPNNATQEPHRAFHPKTDTKVTGDRLWRPEESVAGAPDSSRSSYSTFPLLLFAHHDDAHIREWKTQVGDLQNPEHCRANIR